MASILKALGAKLEELGCPQCCSGEDLTFLKESTDFGGSGTIIGNGFKLERLTRLTDDLVLAEGVNGSGINIEKLRPGETIDDDNAQDFMQTASVALLVGRKEVMNDREALQSMLQSLSPQFGERLGSYDAIGFGEFPLVLRTNDPLIT
jgi:hypothetical protein